jgi:ectoine hydroxylase-related dioxygenase (phytanoyl-CoA dioxygenase family)
MIAEKTALEKDGFVIINNIYSTPEIDEMISTINDADTSSAAFRKSTDVFAIRQFLEEIPQTFPIIFNQQLNKLIKEVLGEDFFVVKSIYFDKPGQSNWFVSYHQDLTISVKKIATVEGYLHWTKKGQQIGVQPPLDILNSIYTIRIHLDDTNEKNGALKVISGSHNKGVYRAETIDWEKEQEAICNVDKGGVMVMRPLLMHASNRTTNANRRRVIHIECCNKMLPSGLKWAEYIPIKQGLRNNETVAPTSPTHKP